MSKTIGMLTEAIKSVERVTGLQKDVLRVGVRIEQLSDRMNDKYTSLSERVAVVETKLETIAGNS